MDQRRHEFPICECGSVTLWTPLSDRMLCGVCSRDYSEPLVVKVMTQAEYEEQLKSDKLLQTEVLSVVNNIHRLKEKKRNAVAQIDLLESECERADKGITELMKELKCLTRA